MRYIEKMRNRKVNKQRKRELLNGGSPHGEMHQKLITQCSTNRQQSI